MTTIELDRYPFPLAADMIVERGWATGVEEADDGSVCIEGAVRLCAPVPGDGAIYREVVIHRGRGATFNDADGTTEDDVLHWLRIEAAPITDDELADVFGPQWPEIVAIVRTAASADAEVLQAYRTACWDLWREPGSAYQAAYQAVLVDGGPGDAALRALGAFVGYGYCARAAAALARRPEIGDGITQEQYDALTQPWRDHFGPAHPDDA